MRVINSSLRLTENALGIRVRVNEAKKNLIMPAVSLTVIPSLRSVDFRSSPLLRRQASQLLCRFLHHAEVENSRTRLAGNELLPSTHFGKNLGPQSHLASQALAVPRLGEPSLARLSNALIMCQPLRRDALAQTTPFHIPFRQQLLVLSRLIVRKLLFFFNLSGFSLKFGLRGLHLRSPGVGIDHSFQNLIVVGLDFLLGEIDFVLEGFVLLVRFYGEHLIAILGDFQLYIEVGGVELLLGGFVSFDGGPGGFELSLGARQFRLDRGHAFGQRGYFFIQTQDFFVDVLQGEELYEVRMHDGRNNFNSSTEAHAILPQKLGGATR